jgi:transposase
LCGPGLCAHVVTAKFADHVPVHRLAGQLARSGGHHRPVHPGRLAVPVQREQRQQREELRRAIRRRDAEPVWDEWSKWLAEQRPNVLPKSLLGTAVGYASNNWTVLRRYLERGFLALDNNLSERTLRAIALGRNNWGVIGSEGSGATAAVLYSVVGTCKHLGIDPFAYLREALPGLFALGEKPAAERLVDWLPDRWRLRRRRDAPARDAVAG